MPIEAKDEPGLRMVYDGGLAIGINLLIFLGLLGIAITIWRITRPHCSQKEKYLLLGAWGILPPVWFLIEYFYLYLPYGTSASFEYFKYGQDVASKLWAAIFGMISIVIYKSRDNQN